MTYLIQPPSRLDATINLPPSKSIANRVLLLQQLIGLPLPTMQPCAADDTAVLYRALQNNAPMVDIHASGTAMRFLTAYYAVQPESEHLLTGSGRMLERPIGPLVDALRQLGADITYLDREGFPPLHIRGRQMHGGEVSIRGDVSSQFVSALLMAAPLFDEGLTLHIEGTIISRSYIDLTLSLMADYGAVARWQSVDTITVEPRYGTQTPAALLRQTDDGDSTNGQQLWIEADWSAASYWYETLALCNDNDAHLTLCGLTDGSRQGDATVRHLFSLLGVKSRFMPPIGSHITPLQLHCIPTRMQEINFHFINQPDLAQTFVVTCCLKDIHFHFTGLDSLRYKESDRITALQQEMRKLGYIVADDGMGGLHWQGERCTPEAQPVISTYSDHRMAMAFAPAAIALGSIRIANPEVVEKSYPDFWDDLQRAGFTIEEL